MDNYWFLYNTSDGSIYEKPYKGDVTEWTNIPDGCSALGFIGDKVTDTVKDAFVYPSNYTITNNTLVANSNLSEVQLANAKSAKIAEMSIACNNAIANEFYSNCDGTMKLYDFQLENQVNIAVKSSQLTSTSTETISYYAKGGACTDYTATQFLQLFSDGETWKIKCITYYKDTLKVNINACTTIAEVNAITWDLANNSASTTTTTS